MQEGCFPGLPIKNLCMSPLLLTMLSSPSSNWILPPAHAVVPSDFRRESSEAQTLLSFLFPNILLIWAVSLFLFYFIFFHFHPYFRLAESASQFRGTPLAFFMVFEARTPRTIKHQENVSREEFETPENTLLVRWQIGRDMAKEQKIMDETEKVDWDPLFFHF